MDVITRHPDGGATLRLSKIELVGFYNLLNASLQPSTPQELEWAERNGQVEQVGALADLIGMPRPTYGE
jgi:hypothetical protein